MTIELSLLSGGIGDGLDKSIVTREEEERTYTRVSAGLNLLRSRALNLHLINHLHHLPLLPISFTS